MPKSGKTQVLKQDIKKKALLKALDESFGIISVACESVGLSRDMHYIFMDRDPAYCEAYKNILEKRKDFIESRGLKRIKEGSDVMTIFLLKTQCRDRGYVERQELEHTIKIPQIVLQNSNPEQLKQIEQEI